MQFLDARAPALHPIRVASPEVKRIPATKKLYHGKCAPSRFGSRGGTARTGEPRINDAYHGDTP